MKTAFLDECGGSQLWMWNVGVVPLHAGVMPPFVYRQGQHNDWLLNEVLASGFRTVVDGTEAVSVIKQVANATTAGLNDSEILLRNRQWESDSNTQLSSLYGSYAFKRSNFSNIPVKLVWCGDSLCFLKASEKPVPCLQSQSRSLTEGVDFQGASALRLSLPGISASTFTTVGRNPFHRRQLLLDRGQHWPHRKQSWINNVYKKGSGFWGTLADWIQNDKSRASTSDCNAIQSGRRLQCDAPEPGEYPTQRSNLTIPLSLDSLLKLVASKDKVVILAVVGNSYRGLLMSWVCRLRVLGIPNFLICALDEDLYQFSVEQVRCVRCMS